jgi:hypothetical protein
VPFIFFLHYSVAGSPLFSGYTLTIRDLFSVENLMPNNEKLKAKLEELRKELKTVSQVNPVERDVLTNLMTDIVNLSTSSGEIEQGFKQTLEEKGTAYEVDHPKVAFAMRQVLDMLTKMGI